MSTKKILVVFGATGNQGGSVVKTILGDPATAAEYHIRAVTRDPSKASGIALTEKGVEVIKANLDDKESLRAALKDAYAVFAVTNFHERLDFECEVQQGKNIANIAKETNVQHLIWSSLPHISKISEGTLSKVLHFDSKAVVENYIRSLNIPATFLLMGLFSEFPVQNLFPLPTDASKYVLAFPIPPNTSLPLISAAVDTGKFVSAILSQRSSLLGKEICAAERMYTIVEMVEILKEAGIDVVYQQVTEEQWKESLGKVGFPEHFQDDLTENSRWFVQYGYFGPGTKELVEEGHKILSAPLETFKEYVGSGGFLDQLKKA